MARSTISCAVSSWEVPTTSTNLCSALVVRNHPTQNSTYCPQPHSQDTFILTIPETVKIICLNLRNNIARIKPVCPVSILPVTQTPPIQINPQCVAISRLMLVPVSKDELLCVVLLKDPSANSRYLYLYAP